MSRPEEPRRHRAMVEGGTVHTTYWRVVAKSFSKFDDEPEWVDARGRRHDWDDIDARRVIFEGEGDE